jgi:REP element-mobilizing transposase RayT
MGRPARIEVSGAYYHVHTRGNDRQLIYFGNWSGKLFVRELERASRRHGWRILAYCLMPNHYHLLVETIEVDISRGMLVLNGSYARYVNWRYTLDGHVFQGPYHDEPVGRDEHFMEACRYIVRNPVRAGLVAQPGDWRWSSYRATGGLERPPSFLCVEFVRAVFGSTRAYREFCNQVA